MFIGASPNTEIELMVCLKCFVKVSEVEGGTLPRVFANLVSHIEKNFVFGIAPIGHFPSRITYTNKKKLPVALSILPCPNNIPFAHEIPRS